MYGIFKCNLLAKLIDPISWCTGPINRKSYHPRLGLARALAKTPEGIDEAKKYYEEVIAMAPEVKFKPFKTNLIKHLNWCHFSCLIMIYFYFHFIVF